MPLDPLLSTSAAAEYLGISPSFLNKLRCTGGGPRYVKIGRRVLYPKFELDLWITAHLRTSTSNYGRCDEC
jgi:predicted DNA-binding transcriptional regulator AlpA